MPTAVDRRVPTALSSQPDLGRWLASLSCQMLSHSSLLSVSFSCYCVLPPAYVLHSTVASFYVCNLNFCVFLSFLMNYVSRGVLKKRNTDEIPCLNTRMKQKIICCKFMMLDYSSIGLLAVRMSSSDYTVPAIVSGLSILTFPFP
jgi:hypothetical protein